MILYITVFVIGFMVSFVELLSRYKKPPLIIRTGYSWVYMIVNGLASVLALSVIICYDLVDAKDDFMQVLVASTSGLVVLRSSVSNIKLKNGESVDIGLNAMLSLLLQFCEDKFDQGSTADDLVLVSGIMSDVEFKSATIDLPLICLELMVTVDGNVTSDLEKEISSISAKEVGDRTKSLLLGGKLFEITGERLLKQGVAIFKENNVLSDQDIEDLSNQI